MATRYIWSRYSRATSVTLSEGDALFSSSNTSGTMGFSSTADMYFAKTLSYSVTTGKFSGGSKVLIDLDEYYDDGYRSKSSYASVSASTYPYLLYCSSGSTTTTQAYTTSGSWRFYTDGTNLTLVKYNQVYKMEAEVSYSQGSTSYGYISSTSSSTYPTDGYTGSYWYVYQGSDSITPVTLTCSSSAPKGGETVTLTVTPSTSNTYGGTITYSFQVSLDGASYEVISETTGTTLTYEIPEGTEAVQFRVIASDSYGFSDTTYVYTASLTVTNNTAPEAPASVTLASDYNFLSGKDVTVSWEASTDVDDNLSGYILELSYNGGSWSQISQTSSTSVTVTASTSWSTARFRVKAYDEDGAESEYTYSDTIEFATNTAPEAPSKVTIPTNVYFDSKFKVSWTTAYDEDGNLEGYELQYTRDSGETWKTISSDDGTTTQTYWYFTIYSGSLFMVRVRAFDSYGEYSDWTYSEERTVVYKNNPPVVSVTDSEWAAIEDGTDLGTFTVWDSEPGIGIEVTDSDGDTMTVTLALDGTTIWSWSGTYLNTDEIDETLFSLSKYIDSDYGWQKILNGEHTLVVTATDGEDTTTWTGTFTKDVSEATITMTENLEVSDEITMCVMTVTGNIPDDATFTAQVTADGGTNWEDATAQVKKGTVYYFENTGTSFNYQVYFQRGTEEGHVISIQGAVQ